MAESIIKSNAWKSSASLEATDTTSISLSSITYKELLVVVRINDTENKEVFYIPKEALSSTGSWIRQGGNDNTGGTGALVTIYVSLTGLSLTAAIIGTAVYTSTTKTKVYYR